MSQPGLFDKAEEDERLRRVVLYALGDFQSRGKLLADRELAIDRLRGALRRACRKLERDEPDDATFADVLERLGAGIKRLPNFVAKHPYRVTVGEELAASARTVYGAAD